MKQILLLILFGVLVVFTNGEKLYVEKATHFRTTKSRVIGGDSYYILYNYINNSIIPHDIMKIPFKNVLYVTEKDKVE